MKSDAVILVGLLIVGACILVSGGIYEGIPSGSVEIVIRLNKITGEVAICTQEEGCVAQKGYHTSNK